MDRNDFYYRQLVSEGNMDDAFDKVEQAIWNVHIDTALYGVTYGLEMAEQGVPDLTVVVAGPGVAIDLTGKRMYVASDQTVDLSVDSLNVSTEVTTPGNKKVISVYIKFARALSNLQKDGNNVDVYYDVDESYEFVVEQSSEGVNPTPPALKSDAILLGDWERSEGQTTFVNANLSTDRTQYVIRATAGNYEIAEGQVGDAIGTLLTHLNNHVTDAADAHAATAIGYAGGSTWADGTTNPAATVEAQLDKIVTDLAGATGSAKVYSAEQDAGGGVTLSAGTVASQLLSMVTLHRSHISDTTDAHAATAISYLGSSNLAATDVEAALDELDTEKGGKAENNTWAGTNDFQALISFINANASGLLDIAGSSSGLNVRTHSGTTAENRTKLEVYTGAKATIGQGADTLVTVALNTNEMAFIFAIGVGVENADVTQYGAKVIAGLGWRAGAGALTPAYILGGTGNNYVRTSTSLANDSFVLQASGNNMLVQFSHNVNSTTFTAGAVVFVMRVRP